MHFIYVCIGYVYGIGGSRCRKQVKMLLISILFILSNYDFSSSHLVMGDYHSLRLA